MSPWLDAVSSRSSVVGAGVVVGVGVAIALFLTLVVIVKAVGVVLRERGRRLKFRALRARASKGEGEAEALLRGEGYAVLARQQIARWAALVDGQPLSVVLRADLLVERGGRRFVAEVKTGRFAPSVSSAATRRQLLEYRCAFDVDGVLLVNADAREIHEVVFQFPQIAASPSSTRGFSLAPLVWIALGVVGGAAISRWWGG